jgi:hypothetical protein
MSGADLDPMPMLARSGPSLRAEALTEGRCTEPVIPLLWVYERYALY